MNKLVAVVIVFALAVVGFIAFQGRRKVGGRTVFGAVTNNIFSSSASLMNGERDLSIKLKWFKPSEFSGHFHDISPDTLYALDKFRELWGRPVTVSPVEGAIVRHGGNGDTSQHNVDLWGVSRAIDFFPKGLSASNAERAYQLAREAGFSGIGIYNDTKPGWMMHGDTRTDKTPENPAKWARIRVAGKRKYVAIDEVFA